MDIGEEGEPFHVDEPAVPNTIPETFPEHVPDPTETPREPAEAIVPANSLLS